MKTIILFLSFLFFSNHIYAHKEWVHQYIINQAYLLLENSVSHIPSFYDSYFRDVNGNFYPLGEPQHPSMSLVTGGAWAEDHYDIVFGHCGVFPGCIEASATHFWNPDGNPYAKNSLPPLTGTFENAFQKAEILWYGNHNIFMPGPFSFPQGTTEQIKLEQQGFSHTQVYTFLIIKYNSLTDLLKSRRYFIIGVVTSTQPVYFSNPLEINYSTNNLDLFFAANILGRVCHLLGDMSVPAHVRIKSHPCDVGNGERYEMEIGGKNWFQAGGACNEMPGTFPAQNYTYQQAINQGGIIKPWLKNNPLKYLFYTSAQITDVYASHRTYVDPLNPPCFCGTETFPGNRTYNIIDPITGDHYSEMENIISAIPTSFSNWSNEFNNISNNALVYSIRVTAGLLYWFGVETGFFPHMTLKNNFNAGIIKFNNVDYPSGSRLDINLGYNYTLTAVHQANNNYQYIWNYNAPVAKSFWEKYDSNNNPIQLTNNYNINYNFVANQNDNKSTYVAGLRKNYKISRNEQTEFDGTISAGVITHIVEQNSGQISAPSTQTINGKLYNFAGWADDLSKPNPRTISPTNNETYTAIYKYANHSNQTNAYKNNSQRKYIRTPDGKLHMVYESMNKVWYEISTDGGSTWKIMNNGKPLSQNASKNPSMDFNGNVVAIIFQEQNGDNYYLKLATFYASGNNYILGQNVIFSDEYSEVYTTNANPVIGWGYDGNALIVWERKNLFAGLVYKYCSINFNSYSSYSEGRIQYSTGLSTNPTIYHSKYFMNPAYFHLAWEERQSASISKIKYQQLYADANNNLLLDQYNEPSYGSGYSKNYQPVIVGVDLVNIGGRHEYKRLIWTGYRDMYLDEGLSGEGEDGGIVPLVETKLLLSGKHTTTWSPITVWGDNVQSISINKGTAIIDNREPWAMAWSEGYGISTNKYVRSHESFPVIRTLNTNGKYLQINNSTNYFDMFSNSFSAYNLPYSFNLSQSLSGGLNKTETISIFNGREGVVIKDSTDFYYAIGDILIDGESVNFVSLPDSLVVSDIETLNTYLVSEPFNVSNSSILIYGVQYGIIDSAASAAALSDGSEINFKVKLIDQQTGELLAIFDDVTFSSANIFQYNNLGYQVDLTGIGNRTVILQLIVSTASNCDYSISTRYSDANTLNKRGYKELTYNDGLLVKDYNLEQNYPNPFNPSTKIKYQIPEDGFVTLKIYDILGKEVATLINEHKLTGRYEVSFNGSNLASGVYIYQLRVKDFVSTKKMLLVK